MKTVHGYPVVTADTLQDVLEALGLRAWEKIAATVSLQEYARRALTGDQQAELRFAPNAEVLFLQNPETAATFTAFRTAAKSWATTFALVPNDEHGPLVPIVAEWKHGVEEVTLVPPSGVMSKVDNNSWYNAAKREFAEETGFALEEVTVLCDHTLQGASTRQNTSGVYPFVGLLKKPVERMPSKLDKNELLHVLLFPVEEWLDVLDRGDAHDQCAVAVTHLALRWLKKNGHL